MTFTNARKITAESHFHLIYSFLATEKQIQVFFKAETRQKHGFSSKSDTYWEKNTVPK